MKWCGDWCRRLFMLGVAVGAFVGGAFLADREIPFVRYGGRMVPDTPYPGQEVTVYWEGEYRRACPGKIVRKLYDRTESEHALPTSEARYIDKAGFIALSHFAIPPVALCGPAKYESTAEYYCNPTHKFWPLRSTHYIEFTIQCPADSAPLMWSNPNARASRD